MSIIVACLMLALLDLRAVMLLVRPYSEDLDIEIFLTDAPLEKIIRARGHVISAIGMFGFATITAVMRAGKVLP